MMMWFIHYRPGLMPGPVFFMLEPSYQGGNLLLIIASP